MINDPYFKPHSRESVSKYADSVRYPDGTKAHKGDKVRDQEGSLLTVIGINGLSGRLIAVDEGFHVHYAEPEKVEVVER